MAGRRREFLAGFQRGWRPVHRGRGPDSPGGRLGHPHYRALPDGMGAGARHSQDVHGDAQGTLKFGAVRARGAHRLAVDGSKADRRSVRLVCALESCLPEAIGSGSSAQEA